MLLSYLRRYQGLDVNNPVIDCFPNLSRVLQHICLSFNIGYSQMDQKESNISKKLLTMDSSGEFIEAVRSGDISKVRLILENSPLAILSRDRKGRH